MEVEADNVIPIELARLRRENRELRERLAALEAVIDQVATLALRAFIKR